MIEHVIAGVGVREQIDERNVIFCERASVRTTKSKSAAVNRARQFALITEEPIMSNANAKDKSFSTESRKKKNQRPKAGMAEGWDSNPR